MDNASKALIIAGAVLIAVMLVSVGVLVYNNAVRNIDESQRSMDRTQVQMLNQEWEQYCGTNKNYATAKLLIEKVDQYNTQNDENSQIDLTGIDAVEDLSSRRAYDISNVKDEGSGLIIEIEIVER